MDAKRKDLKCMYNTSIIFVSFTQVLRIIFLTEDRKEKYISFQDKFIECASRFFFVYIYYI